MADSLPPLPRSLRDLFDKENGKNYDQETDTMKRAKKSTDMPVKENADNGKESGEIKDVNTESEASPNYSSGMEKKLSLLKDEMESLREQDMSLLNQLWTLNESVQELKLAMKDRDNMSECSSTLALDMMIPVIEEHEYENEEFHTQHRYENISMEDENKKEDNNYYEPIYIGCKIGKK